MPLFRRQQTTDGRGSVLVAEFTTGQAVTGLCAAIVLLGAAFVTGRLVARVDRPIDMVTPPVAQEAAVAGDATPPSPTAPAPANEAPAQGAPIKTGPMQTYTISAMEAGADTPSPTAATAPTAPAAPSTPPAANANPASPEPAPSATPASVPANAPAPVEEAVAVSAADTSAAAPPPAQVIPVPPVNPPIAAPKTSPLLASTKPRLTDLPPLPSNHEAAPPTPVRVEKPAEPEAQPIPAAATAAPAASDPIAPSDPPPAAAAATTTPPPVQAASEPAPTVAPPEAMPAPPAAATKPVSPSKSGSFAVQLGSFDGPQRQAKAQTLQKHISKDYGLNAQIENSEKENISRVLLTGYADKNSAAAACAELRKKSGMSGAFVRAI